MNVFVRLRSLLYLSRQPVEPIKARTFSHSEPQVRQPLLDLFPVVAGNFNPALENLDGGLQCVGATRK